MNAFGEQRGRRRRRECGATGINLDGHERAASSMVQAAAEAYANWTPSVSRAMVCVVGAALVVVPAGAFVFPNAGVAPLRFHTTSHAASHAAGAHAPAHAHAWPMIGGSTSGRRRADALHSTVDDETEAAVSTASTAGGSGGGGSGVHSGDKIPRGDVYGRVDPAALESDGEEEDEDKKGGKTMVDDLIRAGAQKVTGVHDAMIHSLHQKVGRLVGWSVGRLVGRSVAQQLGA